jgi:hypothetical protein
MLVTADKVRELAARGERQTLDYKRDDYAWGNGYRGYSCRPRVVENTMLFELRCFHSGLPLAHLAPLLDLAIAGPR